MKPKGKPKDNPSKSTGRKSASIRAARPKKTAPPLEESRERLQHVLSAAHLGVWEWNLTTNEVVWSSNMEEILNVSLTNFTGDFNDYLQHVHPDDRRAVQLGIRNALQNCDRFYLEHRVRTKDNQERWVELIANVFVNAAKRPITLAGTIQDITVRKHIEKEKEDWKIRHELIATSTGLVIYDYNINTGEIVWSGNSRDVLGFRPEELGNIDTWASSIHEKDRVVASELLESAQRDLRPYDVYYRFRRKNGTYCYMHDRGFFIPDSQGNACRMLGMMSDVTARVSAEKTIKESEQTFREIFNNVGEAIFIQEQNGTFIDVNRGAVNMFGYQREDLVGRTPGFLSASDKNDFKDLQTKFAGAFDGKRQKFEFWGRRKDDTLIQCEIRVTKGYYFGREVLISTLLDVTEQREQERALKESEQRFRTLLQASFGGIGLHDQGKIVDCNLGLSILTGYAPDELIGMNGLDLIAPEHRPHVLEKIRSGYELPYDAEGLRKDGTRYALEIHGKNIPYHGRTIRVTEFRDITSRKDAEDRIREQNSELTNLMEELTRKNQQLEEFTQIVSHNLRSPVGNMVTLISMFETSDDDDDRNAYFKHLKESARITMEMLNELNDVLKIKQQKNIERQRLRFDAVLHKVTSMLVAKMSEESASITRNFDDAPIIVYPGIYLESIFLNLISNALKYRHPERNPEIYVESRRDGDDIELIVSDNGLGIDLQRYGHQLFKLRKTFHRHPESRGIGLFMVKNQVEAMGGQIRVDSLPDKGTTFTVRFKHALLNE